VIISMPPAPKTPKIEAKLLAPKKEEVTAKADAQTAVGK
jgi:hypothetical protein